MTLPKQIQQQKELMKLALAKLNDAESIDRLIKPVDPVMAKVLISDIYEQYRGISLDLFNNMLLISDKTLSV